MVAGGVIRFYQASNKIWQSLLGLRVATAREFSITVMLAASKEELIIRPACVKDMDFVTQQTIHADWHIGPYDFPNAYYAFHPSGFKVGEIAKKVIGHVCAIVYPNHHSHMGGNVVAEKYRGNGYGAKLYSVADEIADQRYTVGGEMDSKLRPHFEAKGFRIHWNTYIAMLSLEKIVRNLQHMVVSLPLEIAILKPNNFALLSSLLQYDCLIFGTPRTAFIKRWIMTPGSFCLVAVKESSIVGYCILKQVIRGGGTEIGIAMAPLYADNVHIAKALIKTAAEKSLVNNLYVVPSTKLELFHPVGKNCGDGSSELMEELEAELTHIAYRMYSKGIPPGRKLEKIYGIVSPTFD